MYLAKILADSISPDGVRLTSIEVEYPHAVHKDIMTHRVLSRNFQSFRAFPPEKVIENIKADPFMPEWAHRLPGMDQGDPLAHLGQYADADALWAQHVDHSIRIAESMIDLDVAKQQVNFVLQDLTWIRGIITATDWDNFFALRAFAPEGAKPRPEVEKIAQMMYDAIDGSEPRELTHGDWHLPLVTDTERWDDNNHRVAQMTGNDELSWDYWKKVSTGRCARVSYLTHNGYRVPEKDIELHNRLLTSGHMSPFEHIATPLKVESMYGGPANTQYIFDGNFRGWHQYRKDIPNEDNMMKTYETTHPYWREENASTTY